MNEKEKNLAIYNKLADIAREVFNHVICEPGTYSVADVAKHIYTAETSERVRKVCADGVTREVKEPRITRSFVNGFYWAEGYDPAKDTHAVEVEGFSCKVNGWGVFLVLQKAATAWAIPTAARPVFARKAETVDPAAADSIAATFAVNKELRDLAAIVDPREKLRPVYTYICIDTRRRAAVACNGFTLRVVALPDLLTAPGAADSYLIAPALLKSGKGRVTITADGYASNGATVAPLGEGRFPDWAGLVSSSLSNYNYSEAARVELSRPTFNALKKSVKAAAKLSERVTIAAQSYDTAATVYAHDRDHDRDHESRAELAAPARSSFNVVLRADQFAKLADVTAFYIVSNAAPVLAAASLGFYYFNPLLAENGEKYYNPFNVAPAGTIYDPLADFAEVAAPAADSIESEAETITAAPAADSEADTLTADELAEVAAPAALTAAAELLTLAEVRDAAKAIAKAKTADDYDSQRAARDARRLLTTAHGLTVSDYKIKTADGLTLTRFIYTYGKKSRRTLCAPLLKVAAEFATLESLADEWAELTAAATADSIESEAETTTAAPAADSIETPAAEYCPLTGETLTPGELMTADEIRAAAAAERDRIEREKAETIARADVETLAATWPGLTRAEILAELLTIDTDRAALLLAEVADPDTLTDPAAWLSAPADSIVSEAETIEADPLPLLTIDTAAGVIVWGLADELPTADGLTADTVTPADLLTIEAEHAESERERADRAALLTIATADSQTAESDRAERRPLLLTIARHALRLAAAAALLLLLTIAPDRAADTLAAPADLTATPAPADVMTITPDTLTTAAPAADSIEAGTITAADLLTADSEAESRAELAAPADSPRPAAERRHAPANKRESHARALLTAATADSIAAPLLTIEADTLTAAPLLLTADSIEADTLAAQVATLEAPREITAPADTLAAGSTLQAVGEITDTPTADTDSEADTITTDDEPTDDTDPAAADSQTDSTPTDTATTGHPHAHGSTPATMAAPCSPSAPLAPVAPVLI